MVRSLSVTPRERARVWEKKVHLAHDPKVGKATENQVHGLAPVLPPLWGEVGREV